MVRPLLFALGLVLDLFISVVYPNELSSIVATGLYVTGIWYLFGRDPVCIWFILPFILAQMSVLVSLNAIDTGAYMTEIGQTGRTSGAAIMFCIYSLIMISTAFSLVQRSKRGRVSMAGLGQADRAVDGRETLHPFFHIALLIVILLCVGYLFVAGLQTGFPLLTGEDRFVYRRLHASILAVDLLDLNLLPALALGLAASISRSISLRIVYLALYAALVCESFLFGDKFFIIGISIVVFTMPFVAKVGDRARAIVIRSLPLLAIGAIGMCGVTFAIYSDFGGRSSSETLQRLGDRVSDQAQLWYAATQDNPSVIRFDARAVVENLESIAQINPSDFVFKHSLGPFYFVQRFAPQKLYQSALHNKGAVTPTMVYEAYGLTLFGFVGLVAQMIVSGMILAAFVIYLRFSIDRQNPFLVLLPALVLDVLIKFFAQGTIFNLISVPTVKAYAALFGLELIIMAILPGLRSQRTVNFQRRSSRGAPAQLDRRRLSNG